MFPELPALWLGTPIKAVPKISDVLVPNIKNVGIIISSYDVLFKINDYKTTIKDGIHSFLETNRPVLLDSGGFYFQKRKHVTIRVKKLVRLYNHLKPDLAVALDHPLDPSLSPSQDYYRRHKTLKYLSQLLNENPEVEIMPVIHGYSFRQLKTHLEKTFQIYKDLTNHYPRWLGLGSLVPLFKSIKGTKNVPRYQLKNKEILSPAKFALASIQYVKRMLKKYNTNLHVFGIGGATTMKLVFAAGADSLDSVGWRLKAAHGAIQLIGTSDRFLLPRKNPHRKVLEREYEQTFQNCECGVIPHTRKNLDSSFVNRAIHNAFIYQKTIELIAASQKQNNLLNTIQKLLEHSNMKSLIPFIYKLNNGWTTENLTQKLIKEIV